MPKDFIDLTPGELSSKLSKECGFPLYPFAFFAFSVIREPIGKERFERRLEDGWDFPGWNNSERRFRTEEELLEMMNVISSPNPWKEAMNRAGLFSVDSGDQDREVLRCLKKKIVNLRDKILSTAKEIDELVYDVHYEGKGGDRDMAISWGAAELLCRLQDEYEKIAIWPSPRGRPPSAKTEIACLWAELLRREGPQLRWPLIADLLDWFLARLFPHALYQSIFGSSGASDPEHLKQKFYKQKERWKLIYDYRLRREFTVERPGLPRRRWLLVFGKTWDDFGVVINADSREFHHAGFGGGMLDVAQKIFQANLEMRAGVIFPDRTYSLIRD
jgi:hypothetical protein